MTTITELDTRFPLVGTDGIEIDDGNSATDTERVDISQLALVSFDAVGDANALGKAGHLARYDGISVDRTFTLPDADVTVGDRCAVSNESDILRATGEVIIADGAGSVIGFTAPSGSPNEVTRLFIAGESMAFIAMVGSPNPIWMPIEGRVACLCQIENTVGFAVTTTAASVPMDTAEIDIGGMADLTNNQIVARRPSSHYLTLGHATEGTVQTDAYAQSIVRNDGTGAFEVYGIARITNAGGATIVTVDNFEIVYPSQALDSGFYCQLIVSTPGSQYTTSTGYRRPKLALREWL